MNYHKLIHVKQAYIITLYVIKKLVKLCRDAHNSFRMSGDPTFGVPVSL